MVINGAGTACNNGDWIDCWGCSPVYSRQTVKAVEVQANEATPDVFALFCSPPGLCLKHATDCAGGIALLPFVAQYPDAAPSLKFQYLYWCFCRNAGEQRDSGYRATTLLGLIITHFSLNQQPGWFGSVLMHFNKLIQISHCVQAE